MDLRHSTHERAVEVIQAAGNPVCLVVQSLVHLVRSWSRPGISNIFSLASSKNLSSTKINCSRNEENAVFFIITHSLYIQIFPIVFRIFCCTWSLKCRKNNKFDFESSINRSWQSRFLREKRLTEINSFKIHCPSLYRKLCVIYLLKLIVSFILAREKISTFLWEINSQRAA